MAYLGIGPANTVLVGGTQDSFTANPSMSGTFSSVGLTNTGFWIVNNTSTSTTPYVAIATDYIISMDSTAGIKTVQLPNAPTTGRVFVIKDVAGQAGTNNITVTTVGGIVLIDAATTYVLTVPYQSIAIVFNGTKYIVI